MIAFPQQQQRQSLYNTKGLEFRSSTRPSDRQYPENTNGMTTITFQVATEHAPALRSAVEEFSNLLGTRLEGAHSFAKEAALTDAVICIGTLRAAVNRAIPKGDPNYV